MNRTFIEEDSAEDDFGQWATGRARKRIKETKEREGTKTDDVNPDAKQSP